VAARSGREAIFCCSAESGPGVASPEQAVFTVNMFVLLGAFGNLA
jgi:hypothetical protein